MGTYGTQKHDAAAPCIGVRARTGTSERRGSLQAGRRKKAERQPRDRIQEPAPSDGGRDDRAGADGRRGGPLRPHRAAALPFPLPRLRQGVRCGVLSAALPEACARGRVLCGELQRRVRRALPRVR